MSPGKKLSCIFKYNKILIHKNEAEPTALKGRSTERCPVYPVEKNGNLQKMETVK